MAPTPPVGPPGKASPSAIPPSHVHRGELRLVQGTKQKLQEPWRLPPKPPRLPTTSLRRGGLLCGQQSPRPGLCSHFLTWSPPPAPDPACQPAPLACKCQVPREGSALVSDTHPSMLAVPSRQADCMWQGEEGGPPKRLRKLDHWVRRASTSALGLLCTQLHTRADSARHTSGCCVSKGKAKWQPPDPSWATAEQGAAYAPCVRTQPVSRAEQKHPSSDALWGLSLRILGGNLVFFTFSEGPVTRKSALN